MAKVWYEVYPLGGEGTWAVVNIYSDDENAGWIAKFTDETLAKKFVDFMNGERKDI
jgi:hypothetical protein